MRRTFNYLLLSLLSLLIFSCAGKQAAWDVGSPGRDFSQYTVVIDAGHGGKDGGTRSVDKQISEKNLTLSTSLMLREYLKRKGFRVILTRDKDVYLSFKSTQSICKQTSSSSFYQYSL